MMEKVSAAQINQYMIKSASTIRSLSAENASLKQELAKRDRFDQAEKIASLAVDRGLMGEDEGEEYAEHLATGGEDLKTVEEFVRRQAGGASLGKPLEKTASAETESGEMDVLTAFLLSGTEHE